MVTEISIGTLTSRSFHCAVRRRRSAPLAADDGWGRDRDCWKRLPRASNVVLTPAAITHPRLIVLRGIYHKRPPVIVSGADLPDDSRGDSGILSVSGFRYVRPS